MRKIILFVLLAISATVTMAQTNPKSGYVITNTGDTIRGIIDFRTNEKMSKQCDFWANGGDVKTTYKPGDIEGFRFEHNGKFFVSRRLNVTGEPELYFAEFMVRGKMNLYCITHNSDEFYFFEREDGEIAELTNRATNYAGYAPVALQEIKDNLQEKREQYGKVKSLLQKSWKAVEGMDDNDMSRKKLINVVRDYHNDVCTDGGKCMVYEYNEKSDKKKLHFKIFAGYAYYSTEKSDNQEYLDESYPCGTFEIGIGGEVDLERVMKDLSAEICFIYTPKYKSEIFIPLERMPINAEAYSTIEKSILTFSLGLVKRYCRGKIQPLVRGGIFAGIDMKMTENDKIIYSQYSTSNKSHDWGSGSGHVGGYIGVGAQMSLGKQFVRIHGDVHKALTDGDMVKWGVTAEFGF
jgi:hypothetical protein